MKYLFDAPHVDEEELRLKMAGLVDSYLHRSLDWELIHCLNKNHGTDVASMALWEWCRKSDENGPFYQKFFQPEDIEFSTSKDIPHILLLPTMFYREHPELGGDGILFSTIAKKYGFNVDIIPLESLGSVERNADIILEAFRRLQARSIWVVSFSKGSLDFKRALLKDRGTIEPKLGGWVNIGGTVGGNHITEKGGHSPVKQLMLKSWVRFRGGTSEMMEEIGWSHAYSRALLRLPGHIEIINVVGLPLQCHLRKPLSRTYSYLCKWGPNDGFLVFQDVISIGGHILPLWGADHYMRVPEYSAIAHLLFRRLLKRQGYLA